MKYFFVAEFALAGLLSGYLWEHPMLTPEQKTTSKYSICVAVVRAVCILTICFFSGCAARVNTPSGKPEVLIQANIENILNESASLLAYHGGSFASKNKNSITMEKYGASILPGAAGYDFVERYENTQTTLYHRVEIYCLGFKNEYRVFMNQYKVNKDGLWEQAQSLDSQGIYDDSMYFLKNLKYIIDKK
jgi:hypothetical protein